MSRIRDRLPTVIVALLTLTIVLTSTANAADGLAMNDLKLKRGVADVGATLAITFEGTVSREIYLLTGHIRARPVLTIQQSCRSETDAALVQIGTQIHQHPFAFIPYQTTFDDRGHGRSVSWTIVVSYDPANDPQVGRPNPPGPNTVCPFGFVPITPLTISHVILRAWPGTIGSPPTTKKGELLWIVVDLPAGHTEFK